MTQHINITLQFTHRKYNLIINPLIYESYLKISTSRIYYQEKNGAELETFSSDLRYFNVTNKQISIWFLFSEDYIQKQLGLCFN